MAAHAQDRGEPRDRWFRSGLGSRREVRGDVEAAYRSDLVGRMREADGTLEVDGVTFRLAKELGFCYGVERAVDYAYEAVKRFPDRRVVLTGEIIHNPEVNARLAAEGIVFVGGDEVPDLDAVRPDDVVVLPAFGAPVEAARLLRERGAIVVDTTCGSVLNVWKNVERYAHEGRTTVIHGKAAHEETRATVSRLSLTPGAHHVVLRDLAEARLVAAFVRGGEGADSTELVQTLAGRVSEGFDPRRHLGRMGMANQTTMLATESLEIARVLEAAVRDRHGEAEAKERFRSFDTICSATQDRQDALRLLLSEPLDLVLVVGGFNSSNTAHLLEIAAAATRAWHVEGPGCLLDAARLRHRPVGGPPGEEEVADGWLPRGDARVGLTAGASTPDLLVGAVIERVLALRGGAQATVPRT